ncbi:hypothetical protein [Niabella aquatica]
MKKSIFFGSISSFICAFYGTTTNAQTVGASDADNPAVLLKCLLDVLRFNKREQMVWYRM